MAKKMDSFLQKVIFALCEERGKEFFVNYNDTAVMVDHPHGEHGIRNWKDVEFFFGKNNVDRIVQKLNFQKDI